jgi:hypothetical protein
MMVTRSNITEAEANLIAFLDVEMETAIGKKVKQPARCGRLRITAVHRPVNRVHSLELWSTVDSE